MSSMMSIMSLISDEKDEEDETEEEDEVEIKKKTKPIGNYIGDRNMNYERHGEGWALLPNGDQYEGDFRHGQRHGHGLYIFRNGARYLGQYRCGLKSGKGIFIYPNGSIYDGFWRKDLKHGFGIYYYVNGDVYRGNWYKDKRHGLGTYAFHDAETVFNGTWKNGFRVGPAEIHYKNHSFHGIWRNQYPNGPGVFTFNCKYMNIGYYKSNDDSSEDGKSTANPANQENVININNLENEIGEIENETLGDEEETESIQDENKNQLPSMWIAQEYMNYDFSKLPQQPIPPPMSDSEESVCALSLGTEQEGRKTVGVTEDVEETDERTSEDTIQLSVSVREESATCLIEK